MSVGAALQSRKYYRVALPPGQLLRCSTRLDRGTGGQSCGGTPNTGENLPTTKSRRLARGTDGPCAYSRADPTFQRLGATAREPQGTDLGK